ncbi:MAG TPA: CobW family GTP-binding protein [Usitatibacter sp.]|nr:CobW family GTP-binding protein [Usitatibacter sp.]
MSERVPLLLLGGFLGTGKSTLLSHWLDDPAFAESAVVMNELACVGIDHQLVGGSAALVRLEHDGCICCTLRGALDNALEDFVLQRRMPHFRRVVIEANGLAHPGAILEELAASKLVREAYRLEGIVTAVDAVEGERELDAFPEAFAQVLAADALVVTKTDLAAPEDIERLQRRLAAINPHAPVILSAHGDVDARRVLDALANAPNRAQRHAQVAAAWRETAGAASEPPSRDSRPASLEAAHGPGLFVVTLRPEDAFDPATLRSRIQSFVEHHGTHVLRMKGLVALTGQPGPAVIHVVAGVLYPVRLLSRWPEGAASALVVITRGVSEEAAREALAEN